MASVRLGLSKLFTTVKGRVASAAINDLQSKAKQQRLKSHNSISGSTAAQRRARRSQRQQSLVKQLQHNAQAPIHPLWDYMPSERRSRKALFQLRLRRLWAWLKRKRQRISLVLILYLLFWSIPLVMGEPVISIFAFLPLVLVPPVGYMVYWLVWKEFHA